MPSFLSNISPLEIVSQIFGIIALIFNIICYQMKDSKKLLFWQISASVAFMINLGLKGAVAGVLLNIHAVVRLVIYYLGETHAWAKSKVWVPVFMVSAAVLIFATYSNIYDILALVGTLFTIYSFSCGNPKRTRLFSIPSNPCWFIYHLMQHNIGGVLNEVFVFCSIIVGIVRLDIKKKDA